MEYSIIIILIALLQYIVFIGRVGFTRGKYGVQAPKTTGNETWERLFRVQQNTMEQLIVFIPAMLTFTLYTSKAWVLLPGILFIIGRQIYSHLYVKEPSTRGLGMVLSFFSNIALVIGSLIGLLMSMFA
jgi:glutathione S-transferase